MTITRLTDSRYAVVTDTVLADGTLLSDDDMRLVGNRLESRESRGNLRAGGLLRVVLGPRSLAAVTALDIDEFCVQSR